MRQLTELEAKGYGLNVHCKRVVLNSRAMVYVAIAPDGSYWLVEGLSDAKAFLQKFGVY